MHVEAQKTEDYSTCQQVCYALTSYNYVAALVTLTCIFLVISGIQFWITDYVVSVLQRSQKEAFIIYIIVGALGPIHGVAVSGFVFDRIGGYHGRNTPLVFTSFLVAAGLFAACAVLTVRAYLVSLCLMLQLFCGGITVPVVTGYMLAQLPPRLRTVGNSLAALFYNLLGFFPAPSIYGLAYQSCGSGANRCGLVSVQAAILLGMLVLIPAVLRQRWKDNRALQQRMFEAHASKETTEPLLEPFDSLKSAAKSQHSDRLHDSDEMLVRA